MTTVQTLHRLACETGAATYSDPSTGYQVFTEHALLKRGDCCGNACRHCPYGHIKINKPEHQPRIKTPILLGPLQDVRDGFDVLFWSGGKDSFLCLSDLLERHQRVVLLTTFAADTNCVPIQNIHIKDIAKQADFFNVPVCLVPVMPNTSYRDAVLAGFRVIEVRTKQAVSRICFGDLHLQDLRQWRIQTWANYEVSTPLFGRPYDELLKMLWKFTHQHDVSIRLSTEVQLPNAVLPIGTPYNPALVECLQRSGIDAMLEFGEGHTYVMPNGIVANQSMA